MLHGTIFVYFMFLMIPSSKWRAFTLLKVFSPDRGQSCSQVACCRVLGRIFARVFGARETYKLMRMGLIIAVAAHKQHSNYYATPIPGREV